MASVNSYSAARMKQIEDETVVNGFVDLAGNLLLERRDGETIEAGNVKGPKGDPGADFQYAAGVVELFAGSVPPAGWLICNGASLLRSQYPDLFAAIGTTYGSSGPTTFNIPDMRGLTAVGHDITQTEFNNLGKKGGAKTHTLTVNEIPSHSHSIATRTGLDDSNFSFNGGVSSDRNDVGPAFSSGSAGGDQPHNNLQPYGVFNYIISLGTSSTVGGGTPIEAQYIGRGSTAERDALFGIPGTVAQRVTLANAKPNWFNTDTGRMETFYAINGSAGLSVPGLHTTGFVAGWYTLGAGDWGGKSGPSSWVSAYKVNWDRAIDNAGVINATTGGSTGVLIGLTGTYEIWHGIRGNGNGNLEYGALSLNGDRTAFENRSLNTPITGIWNHDHPAANDDLSMSYFLGKLNAGDFICGGPANNGWLQLGSAATYGYLTIKKVS